VKVLGLMSGTSLDGIDAALLEVEERPTSRGAQSPSATTGAEPGGTAVVPRSSSQDSPSAPRSPAPRSGPCSPELIWELLAFQTLPFTRVQRTSIQRAMSAGGVRDLALLHTRLGDWLAEAVLALLEGAGVQPRDVAAVGSHGQTLWHEPPQEGMRGSSFQLGCPATLAERTGIGVVSDFRARDVAAGGHGAPLVPWADRVFFSSAEGPRALQNLGGIGNVTWLPRAGDCTPALAFDTGPGVVLLDAAASLATGGAASCDHDGDLARRGTVRRAILERLKAHPFFRQVPPRSTGREVFGPEMVADVARELAEESGQVLTPGSPEEGWPDLLATLTALTAWSMGDAYRRWVLPRGVREVFLMGGGARNPALLSAISQELAPIPVRSGEDLGMDPDAREAAAFALLAWAHLKGIPANVPEATGSRGPRVLGSWTPGRGGHGS
jgi:anhydro-N-acetylmuramic acid kinase